MSGNGDSAQNSNASAVFGLEQLCYCGHSKATHQPNCRVVVRDEPCFCPAGFLPLDLAMTRILEQGLNNMNKTLAVLSTQAARLADAVEKLEGSKLLLPGGH